MLYTYISHSRVPKTYHGVTFNYGDKKEVTGTISDKRFVFCYSRPNPSTSAVMQDDELPKQVIDVPEGNAETTTIEDTSVEKPKVARGRKPKVVEPKVEESNSADKD